MVNIIRGVLLTCDEAIKQYIMELERVHKFGIIELDRTTLMLTGDPAMIEQIQQKIEELQDMNTYSKDGDEPIQKGSTKSKGRVK
jgi:hypothetical protein